VDKKTVQPPLNLNPTITKTQKIKEGIIDAIKIGVPGSQKLLALF